MARRKSTGLISKELKKLKKVGLVNIDLRKVTDSRLKEDKKLRRSLLRTINNYRDVIEDKTAVGKVSDKKHLESLKSRGYRVKKSGLVLIEKKTNETVTVDRKGNITFMSDVVDAKTGIPYTKVIREPNFNITNEHDLEKIVLQYAEMYKAETGNRIAFTYYGNISKRTYNDVKEALLAVLEYETKGDEIVTSLNPADVPNALKAVQILEYVKHDNKSAKATAEIRKGNAKLNQLFNVISR